MQQIALAIQEMQAKLLDSLKIGDNLSEVKAEELYEWTGFAFLAAAD